MTHKSPTLILNLDFVTIVSDASNSPSSVCNLCTSLSWLHQTGAEKHSLVMEIPIGATVITIGEGTLTRRFWSVNTRVVVKVTLAARILTLSVTVERREEVSKSDKKSRPSNQCGSKEVRNKHDEQRTGGKKRYESDATKP
ncbi:hypothetical protein YC2023_001598 [Brassica napus]